MSNKYLAILEKEIRNNKIIQQDKQLKSKRWNKSCFDTCARLIQNSLAKLFSLKEIQQLGTSISYKTLQSIFNKEYRIKYPMDPRSLNTLNKLVRFIGYSEWSEFADYVDKTEDNSHFENENEVDLITFVRNAVKSSFDAFFNQDTNGELGKYFDNKESAYKLILEIVNKHKSGSNIISNPYNPSTFEIMDIEIESLESNRACVKTQEYWLLCWWNQKNEKYVKRHKDINEHKYVLHRSRNKWKIRSDVTMSDKYE